MLMTVFIIAFPFTISAQTSSTKTNVAIIQGMYGDFATANVPGVLAVLDAKVEWNEAESFIYGDNKPLIGPDAVVNVYLLKLVENGMASLLQTCRFRIWTMEWCLLPAAIRQNIKRMELLLTPRWPISGH